MHPYYITAYMNQNERESFMDGYSAGDTLAPSVLGEFSVMASTVRDAAAQTFCDLNSEVRPNGDRERSLSVGDVIRVRDEAGNVLWLSCEPNGWDMLDDAPEVLPITVTNL